LEVEKYWSTILYNLTDDDLKLKVTEINELERMDIVKFFQFYAIFEENLNKRIANNHG